LRLKVLIIAPYYHPYINPRAYRWTQIAEQWAQQGKEVYVLTSKHRDYEEAHNMNKVCVHRVGYNSAKEWIFRFMPKRQQIGQANAQATQPLKRSKLLSLFDWVNQILQYVFFPDHAFMWKSPALRKAKQLIQAEQITHIVSVGLPFTAHDIGLSIKKAFPNLKWLCDYGDPYSYQIESGHFKTIFLQKAIQREQQVVDNCDIITVTTIGTQRIYTDAFNLKNEKVVVLPPMVNQSVDSPQSGHNLELAVNKVHLAYFGSFYKMVREPKSLLEALEKLQAQNPESFTKVEFHFFGDIFPHFLMQFEQFPTLQDQIHLHGLVSRAQVSAAMRAMDGLINIGNITDYQLASKSVDYLQSGKPILNFCPIKNDSFKAFTGAQAHILHWQPTIAGDKKVMDFILKMANRHSQAKQLTEFQPSTIAEQYWQLLNEVV